MDAETPRLWRRRTVAAVGTLGIALAGGGLFFPGTASADVSINPAHLTFTGQDETGWKVPDFACGIDWTLQGGSGGTGTDGSADIPGGVGGKVQAHMTVSPGQAFVLRVGGEGGKAGSNTSGDGADGGTSGSQLSGGSASAKGGAGGGATVVLSNNAPILVAGGGGGGGGGEGAAAGGAADSKGHDLDATYTGGAAGTDTSGTTDADMIGESAVPGAGAGGGGFYGGGAGAVTTGIDPLGAGGGGGGSFAAEALTGTSITTASAPGDGSIDAVFTPCIPDTPLISSAEFDSQANTVALSFKPGSGNGADVQGYVYSVDGGAALPLTATDDDNDGVYEATLSDAVVGDEIQVATVATYGNSAVSSAFTVTAAAVPAPTVPDAPSLSAGSTREGEVDLTITPATANGVVVSGWQVTTTNPADESSWSDLTDAATDPDTNLVAATVKGLTPGQTYDFYVRATSTGGPSAASTKFSATVYEAPAVPDAPLITAATSTLAGQVDLEFTAGTDNGAVVDGWEYSTDAGVSWSLLDADGVEGDLTATVKNLEEGAKLTFVIRPVIAEGTAPGSLPSNEVTVASTPLIPPAAPKPDAATVASVTSTVPGQVDLVITPGQDNGAVVEGWEYSIDGGDSWTELPLFTEDENGAVSATVPALEEGAELVFQVRPVTADGAGPASADSDPVTVKKTPVAPPTAPKPDAAAINSATSTVPGEVDLVITPGAANGATVDTWQASWNDGKDWSPLDVTDAPAGTLKSTVKGLTQGSTYSFSVRPVTKDGAGPESPYSVSVKVAKAPEVNLPPIVINPPVVTNPTPIPDKGGETPSVTTPTAPKGVAAVAKTAQVAVAWSAPADGVVDHYVATLKPGGQSCVTTATSCLIGASGGTGYTVSVVAVSPTGVAGPANEVSVTGTAATPQVPAEVPNAPLTLTTDKGTITKATPGQKITIVGTGFMPFSTATVIIYSDPIVLGSVPTDGNGNFSREVEVPANLAAGEHHLVASGVAPDGTERFIRMDITVAPAAGSASHDGELAWTGFEAMPWVLGGVGAVALGAVALLIARRRGGAQL